AGDTAAAIRAFEMAVLTGEAEVRQHALTSLALLFRRDGRYDEAALLWQQVLDDARPGYGLSAIERRAAEALAIHHEHRAKDLASAKRYAETLDSEGAMANTRVKQEVDRRLQRLDRKMSQTNSRKTSRKIRSADDSRQRTMI
ncbi:MAG: hypothetical protein ABI652_03000, partial [Acidobacteriota bacterium]